MTSCPVIIDDSQTTTRYKSAKTVSMHITLGGFVISTKGKIIKERGIVYSTSANNKESLIIKGQGVSSREVMISGESNSFSREVEGFTENMTYYYRAYAISTDGIISYGDVREFILKDTTLGDKGFKITDISVWPNPTRDALNITVVEKTDYILLNIRGQILKKGILTKGKNYVNVSSLSKGIYLLNMKTSKGSFTKKVVKN